MINENTKLCCTTYHKASSDDREWASERNSIVDNLETRRAIPFGEDIAEITNMTEAVLRGTVLVLFRVEVSGHTFAAFSHVAILVNVESVHSLR